MKSIAAQLQWGSLFWVALLTGVVGIALYIQARSLLVGEFDRSLAADMDGLVSMLSQSPTSSSWQSLDGRSAFDVGADRAFELRGLDGQLLAQSASLSVRNLALAEGPPRSTTQSPRWQILKDGTPVRVIERKLERPAAVLWVARNAQPLRRVLAQLAALTTIAGLLLLCMLAFLQWLLVRRALAPLRRITADLSALDLPKPLSPAGLEQAPAELQPLLRALQQALSRIEQGYQRERHFAAAAAHELRTPAAELMTLTDVALRLQPDLPRAQAGLTQARAVARRLAALIQALLPLARTGTEGQRKSESIELGVWLRGVVEQKRGQSNAAASRLTVQTDTAHVVETDPALLQALVENLLENALSHAPENSQIAVRVFASGDRRWFSVANDAPDLLPTDLAQMFDPFWRKSAVREGDGHFGLGLTLAQRLAQVLGLRLSASLDASNQLHIDVVEHIIDS